jgi:hypothetical protein
VSGRKVKAEIVTHSEGRVWRNSSLVPLPPENGQETIFFILAYLLLLVRSRPTAYLPNIPIFVPSSDCYSEKAAGSSKTIY